MNHLQGAFHSALEDIREVLGLGRVYYGFEVTAESSGIITIHPGLAFDFKKNRIISDEPKTLDISFESEEKTIFVCIEYNQVEEGQIEGQPTLIWDSSSVVIRPDIPEPEENLIPVAKLVKSGKDGKTFEIINLIESQRDSETEAATGEEEKNEEEKMATSGQKIWRLRVQQGVIRLNSDSEKGNCLSAMILEPLKDLLSRRNTYSNEEPIFTLTDKEVALDFPISSLTCQAIISCTFSKSKNLPQEDASDKEPSLSDSMRFQSTAKGEATLSEGEFSQHGLSMLQFYPASGMESIPWCTSELTEYGIAHLPFDVMFKDSAYENIKFDLKILKHLQVLIKLDKIDNHGFKVTCRLFWKGGMTEEIIQEIESLKSIFSWKASIMWKALGEIQQ